MWGIWKTFFTVDSIAYACSGFTAFRGFARLLGIPTADPKDQPPPNALIVLGAELADSADGLETQTNDKRENDNTDRARIEESMSSGTLPPACDGDLWGGVVP